MKRLGSIPLCMVVFLLASNLLYAQGEAPQNTTRVGIGVVIGNDLAFFVEDGLFFLPAGLSNIYVPILVSSKFRIEPEIGYLRSSRSSDYSESSFTSLRLGAGIFPVIQRGKMNLYYGLRVGIIRTSTAVEYNNGQDNDESKTDFFIGPGIGGEYFFTDHFSLGGEAQFNYVSIGQEDEDSDVSESAFANRSLIFLRWYF